MQQVFDKLIPAYRNEKPGKLMLLSDAGNPIFAKKKQEDELSHQKKKNKIVMFDFFGALNY